MSRSRPAPTTPRFAAFGETVLLGGSAALGSARRILHDADASDPLAWIAAAAGLDDVELEVLALLGAEAWRADAAGVRAADLVTLLDRPEALAAIAPDASLRRHHLIDIDEVAGGGSAVVRLPAPVRWYLTGDESRDPELPAGAVVFDGEPVANPGRWLVHGRDRVRRWQLAATTAGSTRLLVTPAPQRAAEWAAVVRTAVCRAMAVVVECDLLDDAAGLVIDRAAAVCWIVSTRRPIALTDLPATTFAELAADDAPASADEVANVLGAVPGGHRLLAEQVQLLGRISNLEPEQAVRRLASGALDRLATRIHPRRTWDDLVLAPDKKRRVREVVARVEQHRRVYGEWGFKAVPSDGVAALFAGPPGTGKTMAAEIIAGELGLDAFKIDLSTIVSKYIGETEKHLEQLFDAAEGGGVLLLFDEADALFGKRTSVDDAHDRYANIETSYLLQRLEAYSGVVILTTNMAANIDEAFTRRLHAIVSFELPTDEERRRIWDAAFPPAAPVADDVDLAFLARQFRLSGGSIRSASLTAAFVAAQDGDAITMSHVMHGMKREYQKLGRIVSAQDFGDWLDVVSAGEAPGSAG